jgi:hypothetical protein
MKGRQRTEKRCTTCGDFPSRDQEFRNLLWDGGIPARDVDLYSDKFYFAITRNDNNRQDEGYRKAIDERRELHGDDAADSSAAEKLGFNDSHTLLVVFPKDLGAGAILWVRRVSGCGGWKSWEVTKFLEAVKKGG